MGSAIDDVSVGACNLDGLKILDDARPGEAADFRKHTASAFPRNHTVQTVGVPADFDNQSARP